VIDRDPQRKEALEGMGLHFIHGDATSRARWNELEPDSIQAVAVMLPDDDDSLQVVALLRDGLGIERVVARVHDATRSQEFSELGVGVVNPSLSPVVELEYQLLYPSVTSLIADLEDEHEVVEVRLGCDDYADTPLREISLPDGVMVVLVRRNGDVIYPRGDTRLQIGDQLTLIGSVDGVRDMARACE
jgi:Trk K+ transport system NAD-binding subunit